MLHTLKKIGLNFSTLKVPVIDVSSFLSGSPAKAQCQEVAEALHKFGCLVIKDPRVNQPENDRFLDMMERYFDSRGKELYAGKNVKEIFPDLDYQVGATPQYIERCKDHKDILASYQGLNKAATPSPPPFDAKWRYFWNISSSSEYIAQYPNHSPVDFPEWTETMDTWGKHMIEGVYTVAEMAAIGMGMERRVFCDMMDCGDHKLAPTGSDLEKFNVGTIFAGHHYDFNFLTIHGKSRYPGLFAWLRSGEKFTVQVPEGHLLLQAGKQFEWATGGYINCGYHEVIYTQKTEQTKKQRMKEGKIPWRVSSTLFSHFNQKVFMKPLGKFATPEALQKYPEISVAEHTIQELSDINLHAS